MKEPTCIEIAEDRNLWSERVDPDNNDPEAFDRMTAAERLDTIHDMFPDDCNCDDVSDWEEAVNMMDDEIREPVHAEIAPCSKRAFLMRYRELHRAKYDEEFVVN